MVFWSFECDIVIVMGLEIGKLKNVIFDIYERMEFGGWICYDCFFFVVVLRECLFIFVILLCFIVRFFIWFFRFIVEEFKVFEIVLFIFGLDDS